MINNLNGSSSAQQFTGDSDINQAVNVSEATQLENNFIALMVAEIKNQDPTDPLDSTQFLNQFSSMSQVKSMENMASMSQSNLILMDNMQTLAAASLVGKEVKVAAENIALNDQVVRGQLQLEFSAGATEVTLTDSNGKSVKLPLGDHSAGTVPFAIDPKKLGLSPGNYHISATTDSGETPIVEISGQVTQVRVSVDGPVLEVKGAGTVPLYQITEFGQPNLAGSP